MKSFLRGVRIMKSFTQYIIEAKKTDMSPDKVEAEIAKMISGMKPVTICDLLSDSTPARFLKLYGDIKTESPSEGGEGAANDAFWRDCLKATNIDMKKFPKNQGWDRYIIYDVKRPKWYAEVKSYVKAMYEWYYKLERKDKSNVAPLILKMAKCGKKADWASWSGKAYRGLVRSPKQLAKYKLTGEVVKVQGLSFMTNYLVAKVNYKSDHAIQSWTSKRTVADGFSMSSDGKGFSVIIEINIGKNEGFFSPKVSNKLFTDPHADKNEFEVLRLSNNAVTCTAHINMDALISDIDYEIKQTSDKIDKKKYMQQATKRIASILGADNAKKILDPKHPFVINLLHKAGL